MQFDRESLSKFGLDKTAQDKIYKSIYIHCHGIHEAIQSFRSTHADLPSKMWEIVVTVFQFYDPDLRNTFLTYLKHNQDKRTVLKIERLEEQVDELLEENQRLRDANTKLQLSTTSAFYERQLSSTVDEHIKSDLSAKVEHFQAQLQANAAYVENLKQSLLDRQECAELSEQLLHALSRQHIDTLAEVKDLRTSKRALEKEHFTLKAKYSAQEQALKTTRDELASTKEELRDTTRELMQLQDDHEKLTAEHVAVKEYLVEVQADLREVQYMERMTFDTLQEMLKFFNLTTLEMQHFFVASNQLETIAQLPSSTLQRLAPQIKVLPPKFTFNSHKSQHPENFQTISFQEISPSPSVHENQDRKAYLQQLVRQGHEWMHFFPRMHREYFCLTQQSGLRQVFRVLCDKGEELIVTQNENVTARQKLRCHEHWQEILGAVSDRLQTRVEERGCVILQLEDDKVQLQKEIADLKARLADLQQYEEKYIVIEPKFLRLVDMYKQLVSDKNEVDEKLLEAQKTIVQFEEKEIEWQVLGENFKKTQQVLEEKNAFIGYLQNEQKKVAKYSEKRRTTKQAVPADRKPAILPKLRQSMSQSMTPEQLRQMMEGVGDGGDAPFVAGENDQAGALTSIIAGVRRVRSSFFSEEDKNAQQLGRSSSVASQLQPEFDDLETVMADTSEALLTSLLALGEMVQMALEMHNFDKRIHRDVHSSGRLTVEGTLLMQSVEHVQRCLLPLQDQRENILYDVSYVLEPRLKHDLLEVLDALLLLPAHMLQIMHYADELYDLRWEKCRLQLELDKVKLYSAKERSRIIEHYENQLYDARTKGIEVQSYAG